MFLARSTSESALLLRSLLVVRNVSTSSRLLYAKDDDASSSDDEKHRKKHKVPEQATKQPEESAASRLNRLLASMPADDNSIISKPLNMAKPGEAHKKRKEASKEQTASKDVFAAAKRVAALLGEDSKKQTESELLAKLMGHKQEVDSSDNQQETNAKKESGETELSLSDLISGMKIDRRQQPKEETRSEFVRRTLVAKSQQQPLKRKSDVGARNYDRAVQKREAEHFTGSVNLFGGEALNIFKDTTKLSNSPDMLRTWAHLQKRELELQVSRPPENYFEKLALWTEQGKVWKFPIDNEQDMNEEANVDFSEHIFLEQHLEPWCPNRGPIRHFMELVCVGLSKNPYISAKDKKEHILWYRNYFEEKKEILKDYIKSDKNIKKPSDGEKQLES